MPPKLSKEKAALKKAEKAQYAEIDRRMEQELLTKETLEIARRELEAKIKDENEQAWLKAEKERLSEETESMQQFFERQHETLSKVEAAAQLTKDWELFLDTSGLPHASDEATVNTYLAVGYSTLDLDFDAVLRSLLNIYKTVNEAEELALLEDQKGNAKVAAKYRGFMQPLETLGNVCLDQTTNYLLQKSYAVYREMEKNIVTGRVGDWKLALWINHVKNPRFRVLELHDLDIFINLPKSFALANIAIRILHQTVNPLYCPRNSYMPLGGVFIIDVLALPIETKIVKQWTLENLAVASSLIYLGYPIPAIGQSAPSAQQLQNLIPFEIDIVIPSFIVHWNPIPEESETWQTEGVTEIVFDPENFKLQFHTTKAKPHAIIQSRVREVPFQSWNIRPTSSKSGLLTLKTAVIDVLISIGEGWCQLLEPKNPVLSDLQSQHLPPKVLLQQLAQRGLNLMPKDEDAQFVHVEVKDTELEKFICHDASLAIPAFTLASSHWNKQKGANTCIVRLQEIPEPLYSPTLEKSRVVKTVVYLNKGCTLLDYSDKLPEYTEKLDSLLGDKLATYHASILVTLQEKCLETSQNKTENGNVAFSECVNALMYALRLFSFGP